MTPSQGGSTGHPLLHFGPLVVAAALVCLTMFAIWGARLVGFVEHERTVVAARVGDLRCGWRGSRSLLEIRMPHALRSRPAATPG